MNRINDVSQKEEWINGKGRSGTKIVGQKWEGQMRRGIWCEAKGNWAKLVGQKWTWHKVRDIVGQKCTGQTGPGQTGPGQTGPGQTGPGQMETEQRDLVKGGGHMGEYLVSR